MQVADSESAREDAMNPPFAALRMGHPATWNLRVVSQSSTFWRSPSIPRDGTDRRRVPLTTPSLLSRGTRHTLDSRNAEFVASAELNGSPAPTPNSKLSIPLCSQRPPNEC